MVIPERKTKRGDMVQAFQVDDCFAEEVTRWTWHVDRAGAGYIVRTIEGKKKRLHRFIWELAGRDPVKMLDHVNGDTKDNRLENLREATPSLNSKNRRRRKPTREGLPEGVSNQWNASFASRIHHRGRTHHLGNFSTPEDASVAYENAKQIIVEFSDLPGYEQVLDSIAPPELLEGPRIRSTRLGLPVGVKPEKNGRFGARIGRNKKTIHLGVYDTPEQAAAAYQEAKARIS